MSYATYVYHNTRKKKGKKISRFPFYSRSADQSHPRWQVSHRGSRSPDDDHLFQLVIHGKNQLLYRCMDRAITHVAIRYTKYPRTRGSPPYADPKVFFPTASKKKKVTAHFFGTSGSSISDNMSRADLHSSLLHSTTPHWILKNSHKNLHSTRLFINSCCIAG